jgi:hypothetical protein
MSDKSFKVKSGLTIPALSTAGVVKTDSSGVITSSATLGLSEGGTGQTTAANALNALLPLQTGNDNKYLQTNGVTTQWNSLLAPVYQAEEPSSPAIGQIWIESDSSSTVFDSNIIRRQSFTATAGQTAFGTAIGFIDGYEQVYFNGLLLLRGTDYTTTGGNTVTLSSGAAVDDIIEVIGIANLNSANTYTQEEIDSAILVAVPDQTGHGNKFLTTDGTSTSWGTVDTASLEVAIFMGAY